VRIFVKQSEQGLVATLLDRDDFASFSVEMEAGPDIRAGDRTVDGAVRFETPAQAWVSQDWLRSEGRFDEDEDASASLGRMLEYAETKGWVDSDSGAVAAHVERSD
jgi:hypothetical protein